MYVYFGSVVLWYVKFNLLFIYMYIYIIIVFLICLNFDYWVNNGVKKKGL